MEHTIRPIAGQQDVEKIRKTLQSKPRDLLLFDLITQTGCPLDQLLRLRVGTLAALRPGDAVPLNESGAENSSQVMMNELTLKTFNYYCTMLQPSEDDYLFKSRKSDQPIDPTTVSHLVRRWYQKAGLKGLTGVKSLRKTWEKHYKKTQAPATTALVKREKVDALQPLKSATLQEAAYTQILASIRSGLIPPGSHIVTKEIAARLNVSPMPVRDALARLQATGFISSAPNQRAYFVNELSRENLLEIASIRIMLESRAIEAACRLFEAPFLQELIQLHKAFVRMVSENRSDEITIVEKNREWHLMIYRQAKMPVLIAFIERLQDMVSPYFHILLREVESFSLLENLRYYEGIIKGLKQRNAEKVCRFLKEDIEETANHIVTKLNNYLK